MDLGVKVISHVGWNSIAELVEIIIGYVASDDWSIPHVAAGVHELDQWTVIGISDGTRLADGWWKRFRGARYKFVNRAEVNHAAAASHVIIDHPDLLGRGERAGIHRLGGEAQFRSEVDSELGSISFVTRIGHDPPIVSPGGIYGLV